MLASCPLILNIPSYRPKLFITFSSSQLWLPTGHFGPHPLALTVISRGFEAEVFTGQMPFLSLNQQHQNTESTYNIESLSSSACVASLGHIVTQCTCMTALCHHKCQMSKTFIGGYVESLNRRRRQQKKCLLHTESYAAANSSVFRCALNVVMVVELLVDEDREFHTVGAAILKALHWKLIIAAGW